MSDVHIAQQGKGGCGKSFTMALKAQYIKKNKGAVICADTDPVNATFSQYRGLDVAHIEIARNGNVMQRNFDPLMESILQTTVDVVIDNGAATFLPLTQYMAENEIYRIMAEHGKKVYVHTVLTGGQAKSDTYNGFAELVRRVDDNAKIVIWQNEFWGPVEYDGHSISEGKLYQEADRAGKIAGIVRIADRSHSDSYQSDIKRMTEAHLTLDEVLACPDFGYMSKDRLKKFMGEIFDELDRIAW